MINKLRRSFEKIHKKIALRKNYFKAVIDEWQHNGWQDEYQRSLVLFLELDKGDRELQSNFLMVTAEGLFDELSLQKKIRNLRSLYYELCQLTKPVWRQWLEAFLVAAILAFVIRSVVFGLYHVPSGSGEPNILIGDRLWANKFIYFFKTPQRGDLVIFDNPEFVYAESNYAKVWWQRYIGIPIPFLGVAKGPDNVVKRIIALPSDVVEGRIENGQTVIYINGQKLQEPYVNRYPLISIRKMVGFIDRDSIGPLKIPYFLRKHVYPHMGIGCTYDLSKTFEMQSFYTLDEQEVLRNQFSGQPILSLPGVPTYEFTSEGTLRCVDEFGPLTVPANMYWVMGDSRRNSHDSRYWQFLDGNLIHGRASFVIFSLDSYQACWFLDLLKHPFEFWAKEIRWNRFLKKLDSYNEKN